jgi:ABC-type nitrate/sulfonate/bicarbonate transport system substrate-binding protein
MERWAAVAVTDNASKTSTPGRALRLGFVPLIDAAPLIIASEQGYFLDEGLRVELCRQIGWGNVRDKLTFGQLDASHALLGMTPVSVLGTHRFDEPLVTIAALGTGGNAITLSRKLASMGVTTAEALARLARNRTGKKLTFAHVFSCSMHHYLLREWLASAQIHPDEDVNLCVLPPPQMARQMAQGMLDGFCVGDPWNQLAADQEQAVIATATTRIVPDHPEKVLAVSRQWLAHHGEAAQRLVRAVLRGCAYCADPQNAAALGRILARPRYLDLPEPVLLRSLRDTPVDFRSWSPVSTFPSVTHVLWLLEQMARWNHVPLETDLLRIARQAIDTTAYRAAAESLNWPCPADDQPPMRLKHGIFEAGRDDLRRRRPPAAKEILT